LGAVIDTAFAASIQSKIRNVATPANSRDAARPDWNNHRCVVGTLYFSRIDRFCKRLPHYSDVFWNAFRGAALDGYLALSLPFLLVWVFYQSAWWRLLIGGVLFFTASYA